MENLAQKIAAGHQVEGYTLTLRWSEGKVFWLLLDEKTGVKVEEGSCLARSWANSVYSYSWHVE